jgi:hydroxymethylpyrimidine pyrophosphatase-like HAD family hydrolase
VLLESYGIDPSEIIAIGDFYNDLDMIEYADLGIAMGNAPDDVKGKANDVTLSNDEDGVFYAVEKHLKW